MPASPLFIGVSWHHYTLLQYGGPDGEAGAAMRYMSQKYAMSNPKVAGLLNDIATEELGHLEIVGTIVHQLTKDLPCNEVDTAGFEKIGRASCRERV